MDDKRKVEKPVSLAPLTLEQALSGAMLVPLPPKAKKSKPKKTSKKKRK